MSIEILRLLFDFGLLVLIWIVQLVIYPSFQFYQKRDLLKWHKIYTGRIGLLVMPLMLGQLFLTGIQLSNQVDWYTGSSALFVAILWINTFAHFIPLHQQISNDLIKENTLNSLVNSNWLRTVLWTLLFGISLWYVF